MAVKKIKLKGDGIQKEALANAAGIKPGHLVELMSTGKLRVHATAGAQCQRGFALENNLIGDGIDDAYASGDNVIYEVFPPGCEVNAFIDVGENITKGDLLISSGDGSLKGLSSPGIVPTVTGAVTDDDDAATNGTAVYAHIDRVDGGAGFLAHLESVTAGNANSYFDIGTSGPRVRVLDDNAAATGGLQVYFDEDAANEDSRFLINNTLTGKDLFLLSSTGQLVRLKHDANAATTGVALYFDDNGATVEARLLFVSPTNTAGAYDTDDDVGLKAFTGPESVLAIALQTVNNSAGSDHARCIVETL